MSTKHKLAASAAALLTAAGGGGAIAATNSSSTNRNAFLDDAAGRLHVTPAQLQSALGGAYTDRLNAAVKAHRLTPEQAQRLERGGMPWLRFGHQRAALRHGLIRTAASYLGLTPAQLRAERQSGKSLAQIAQAQQKSVSGLEAALTAVVRQRLDRAVQHGRISAAAEQRILANLPQRLKRIINRVS